MNYHPSLTLRHTSLTLALPPFSTKKNLQHARTHTHIPSSLPSSLLSSPSVHPSILCSGCSLSPLLCPSCSEWASLLLPPSSCFLCLPSERLQGQSQMVINRDEQNHPLPSKPHPLYIYIYLGFVCKLILMGKTHLKAEKLCQLCDFWQIPQNTFNTDTKKSLYKAEIT